MSAPPKPLPAWMLWANPIFLRYCRSRLRARVLSGVLLVLVTCAAFVFLMPYLYTRRLGEAYSMEGARLSLLPLFGLQGFVLMLLGTNSVAAGLSRDSIEGTLDYQRLTPMSAHAKVAGYLFGLPIREYVMFAATMPFVAYAAWVGQVSWSVLAGYYAVFFSCTLLYHLVGLVAGLVMRKRFSGRLAQVLVIILYLVMPQMKHLGFGVFGYFTVLPEFFGGVLPELARSGNALLWLKMWVEPRPLFFQQEFSVFQFSLLFQAGIICLLWTICWRKWKREDHHLLSKPFALGALIWLATILLGTMLPTIESGDIFISSKMAKLDETRTEQMRERAVRQMRERDPDMTLEEAESRSRQMFPPARKRSKIYKVGYAVEGSLIAGFFGMLINTFAALLCASITPTNDRARQGMRRAAKLGKPGPSPVSDPSSSLWWTVLMGVGATAAWILFWQALRGSEWLGERALTLLDGLRMAGAILLPLICFQGVMESMGKLRGLLVIFFLWVVPPLLAVLMAAAQANEISLIPLALSAFTLPVFSVLDPATASANPAEMRWWNAAVFATYLSLAWHLALAIFFQVRRARNWRRLAANPAQ